eukprot:9468784-Pyramimonas_sp.AAC.1
MRRPRRSRNHWMHPSCAVRLGVAVYAGTLVHVHCEDRLPVQDMAASMSLSGCMCIACDMCLRCTVYS